MLFVVILFASLCFMAHNHIKADYILSFTRSDLHFLKKIMDISSIINKDCPNEFDTKRKVIKEFIKYGNEKGFTESTQFVKGYTKVLDENQSAHQIQFDPTLFDLPQNTLLTISIFQDWSFTISEPMEDLIKMFLQKHQSNRIIKKSL